MFMCIIIYQLASFGQELEHCSTLHGARQIKASVLDSPRLRFGRSGTRWNLTEPDGTTP